MSTPMRSLLAIAAVSTALTGCVVYDPGYGPYYAAPAPAYAYPSYSYGPRYYGYYGPRHHHWRRFERP